MRFWTSYDALRSVAWVCILSFAIAIREALFSNAANKSAIAFGVMAATVAIVWLALYLMWRIKKRSESKVKASEIILLTDIQALAKSNSNLLGEAIALHATQTELERDARE